CMLDGQPGDVDLLAVEEAETEVVIARAGVGGGARRQDDAHGLREWEPIRLEAARTRPFGLAGEPALQDGVGPGAVVLEVGLEPGGKTEVVARGAALVEPGVQRVGLLVVPQRRRRRLDLVQGDFHGGPRRKAEYIRRLPSRKRPAGPIRPRR